jgi:hypothetical protein
MFNFGESHPVLAYIDPGTGSYLVQLLIATILGSLFALKTYWRKIIRLFSDKFSKSKES